MDANRFDDLAKRIATARLTRVGAIRGLAGGAVAALAGVSLTASEAEARKNGKKKRKKKRYCLCTGSSVSSCSDQKTKKKKKKKKALKNNPCSYKGKCRGFNPCSPAPTSSGPPPASPGFPIEPDEDDIDVIINIPCITPGGTGECAADQECVTVTGLGLNLCVETCTVQADCTSGACVLGFCLPVSAGGDCDTGEDCETGSCVAGICAFCDVLNVCGTGTDAECCAVGAECDEDLDICVFSAG